uniref:Uncharacterized protein n=1 Tax=Kalanchoe fedtschenkoi TaxID=63787 RepID=A0A7N0VMP0_KALFE
MAGLVGRMGSWVSCASGKRQCRRLFWRVKAAVRKALNKGGDGRRGKRFQYDPWSYALNFDDGDLKARENISLVTGAGFTVIYVLWLNP